MAGHSLGFAVTQMALDSYIFLVLIGSPHARSLMICPPTRMVKLCYDIRLMCAIT